MALSRGRVGPKRRRRNYYLAFSAPVFRGVWGEAATISFSLEVVLRCLRGTAIAVVFRQGCVPVPVFATALTMPSGFVSGRSDD